MLSSFVDLFLHLDQHLDLIISEYGVWTYLILFVIIFCETGLVVTPFLPGDSLVFAATALATRGGLRIEILIPLLLVAAVLGDAVNYSIGAYLGPKVFENKNSKIFKPQYLEKTHHFYEKYGGKTIVIARFVPIVRTFAPFVAGVGQMSYPRFAFYNVTGAVLWVCGIGTVGYLFGNLEIVKNNFSIVIMLIIFISITPGIWEMIKARRQSRSE